MTARTLVHLLQDLRESPARIVFPGDGDVLPHRELPALAAAAASRLAGRGVRPGEVVGLLIPTSLPWLPAYFGIVLTGAAVAVLPVPPIVLDPVATARQLSAVVEKAGIRHVVAAGITGLAIAGELARLHPGLEVVHTDGAVGDAGSRWSSADPDPDATVAVQFSSGSTDRPKGVLLTHRMVLAGVDGINAHLRTQPDDVLVQWVPLFHDMGVVALLCSLRTPSDAHLFNPMAFMKSPAGLLSYIAGVGGSIVTGPDFSYAAFAAAAGKAFGVAPAPTRLSRWRLALNGSEFVKAETVRTFTEALVPFGATRATMLPCYGMAEATLAVTMPALGGAPRFVSVDRRALTIGERVRVVGAEDPGGRVLVGLGVPIPGMQVRVCDVGGGPLGDGSLGEIRIKGPAVTSGYLHDEAATRQALVDGWFRTGDLGFFVDGELFLAGRLKEMIVVRGRNYFAEDVEQVARTVPGIHKGNCVAIADPSLERITIVAELAGRDDPAARDRLTEDILAATSTVIGSSAIRVFCVAPRTLPRTTSGKWQRSLVAKLVAGQRPDI